VHTGTRPEQAGTIGIRSRKTVQNGVSVAILA